jgi:hypothetical protein
MKHDVDWHAISEDSPQRMNALRQRRHRYGADTRRGLQDCARIL